MDNGYDHYNENVMENFNNWAERVAEKTIAKELEYIPDSVGFMACLMYAARKVALRRDLMTKDMACQIFRNFIDDICHNNFGKA